MQFGVDTVGVNRDGDDLRTAFSIGRAATLSQALRVTSELPAVALDDGGYERLLAGEVLVKRTDTHTRHFRDAVGAGLVEAFLDENASGRFDQRVDRRARSLLRGDFLGFVCGLRAMGIPIKYEF